MYTDYKGYTVTSSKTAWEYTDFDAFINALATTGIKLYNSSDIIKMTWYNYLASITNQTDPETYEYLDYPVETLRCQISSDNRILTFYLESGHEFYFCSCSHNLDHVDREISVQYKTTNYYKVFTDLNVYAVKIFNITGTTLNNSIFQRNIEFNPGSKNIIFVPVTVCDTIEFTGSGDIISINFIVNHWINTDVYNNMTPKITRFFLPGCSPDKYTVIPKARHSFYSSSADVNVIKVFCSPESVENINKSNGITPELPGYIYLTEESSSKLNDYIYKVNCSGAVVDIPLANLCLIPHNKRLNATGGQIICSPGAYFYAYKVDYSNQLCSTRIYGGKFRKHSFILQHGYHLPVNYLSNIVKALNTAWVFQTANNMYSLHINKKLMIPTLSYAYAIHLGLDPFQTTIVHNTANIHALIENSTVQSKNNFFWYPFFNHTENPDDDYTIEVSNQTEFSKVSITPVPTLFLHDYELLYSQLE